MKNLKNLQVFTNTKLHELLIVNNLHEKSFTDNQDWQNFDSACYLWYAFVLQLNALVYMKNALIFSRSDARNSFMYIITSEITLQCCRITFISSVIFLENLHLSKIVVKKNMSTPFPEREWANHFECPKPFTALIPTFSIPHLCV